MKIRFVLCHPNDVVEGEERQVFLADKLAIEGHDVAVYCIGLTLAHDTRLEGSACEIRFFKSDAPQTGSHDTYSTDLTKRLQSDNPDIVLIKGIDYEQATRTFHAGLSGKLGVIIGGVSSHSLLDQCDMIYFETELQAKQYHGSAPSCVLPKYIDWTLLDSVQPHTSVYDIVNVGNFDEDRKAQELLIPLAHLFRIVLIGGGRRLVCFRDITGGLTNAAFPGYLEKRSVFSHLLSSRLMVHPSTWDGYPRAVAEAFAAGIPVIGQSGVLGGITSEPFLIGSDTENLVPTVCKLLRDPERLDDLSRQARKYMRVEASHDNLLKRFWSLLPML